MPCIFKLSLLIHILSIGHVTIAKKNVLFLAVDDLRPQIDAYLGDDFPPFVHPKMHTPNLDALAARSLVLKRAYVQQAVSLSTFQNTQSASWF